MKTLLHCMTAAAVALTGAATLNAQTQSSTTYALQADSFYVHVDAGGNLVQSVDIRNAGGAKNSVDPGFRTTASVGVNFSDYFAGEFESGVLGNSFDTSAGQPLFGLANHVDLYQVPLLVNAIVNLPLRGGITPYFGAGAGGMASTLYLHSGDNWARDTDFTFAYQAMGGLKFALNRNMNIGVGYKFLATPDHTWFGDNPALFVRSGQVFNHSILATFTWTF